MKKSIIAAGAASVALAAMPIVGAFATTSVKDSVTATIGSGCTITNAADAESTVATNSVTMNTTPGNTGTSATSAGISFVCNAGASESWAVSAVAAGEGTNKTSLYSGAEEIATGTATSGDDSAWAFKIAEAANATIAEGYNNFVAVPGTSTPVVTGTGTVTTTVKPQYQIYAAQNQTAGNYTGAVSYTVAISE